MSLFSTGSIVTLAGKITGDYAKLYANQVHPSMQILFPAENDFQMDN